MHTMRVTTRFTNSLNVDCVVRILGKSAAWMEGVRDAAVLCQTVYLKLRRRRHWFSEKSILWRKFLSPLLRRSRVPIQARKRSQISAKLSPSRPQLFHQQLRLGEVLRSRQ